MAVLKSISGHSKELAKCRDYLILGTGDVRKYLEGVGGDRCLAHDFVNLPLPYQQDNWDTEMDRLRKVNGNDKDWGPKRAVTYRHFVISPDPEDRVGLDELRDLAKSWAEEEFGTKGKHGCYQCAIFYHDDNSERIEKGLPGVPHAHIIVNNTDLHSGYRLQLSNSDCRGLGQDLQRICMERGLAYFTVEKVEASENMKVMYQTVLHKGLSPEEREKLAVEREIERLYGEEVIESVGRRRDHRPSAQDEYRTFAERSAGKRGEEVWKDTLRQCITIACNMSSDMGELVANLAEMGIVATEGKNRMKQGSELLFYYPNPDVPLEENKRRVYGGRLGKRFTNKGLMDQMLLAYYRHLPAEDRNDLRVIDLVTSITTFKVTDGRTLTDLELRDITRAFSAITTYNLQNMDEARSQMSQVAKILEDVDSTGSKVDRETYLKMHENLSSLMRVAEYTDLLPDSVRMQKSTPKDIEARRTEAAVNRGRKTLTLKQKIDGGLRLTESEHRQLKSSDPAGYQRWLRNRKASGAGRPTSSASGGGKGNSRRMGSQDGRRSGGGGRSDNRTQRDRKRS